MIYNASHLLSYAVFVTGRLTSRVLRCVFFEYCINLYKITEMCIRGREDNVYSSREDAYTANSLKNKCSVGIYLNIL